MEYSVMKTRVSFVGFRILRSQGNLKASNSKELLFRILNEPKKGLFDV
jgi:hypothetical protein